MAVAVAVVVPVAVGFIGFSATIRTNQESYCLPYAELFLNAFPPTKPNSIMIHDKNMENCSTPTFKTRETAYSGSNTSGLKLDG